MKTNFVKKMILALIFLIPIAYATEHLIPLQGRASDSFGNPLSTGDISVRVYNASTGDTLVYDSGTDFNNVIQDGAYDIFIRVDLDNTKKYYMEIGINGEEVVGDATSGRQEFWPGGGDHTNYQLLDAIDELSILATTIQSLQNLIEAIQSQIIELLSRVTALENSSCTMEVCDCVDNDCDGEVDEGCAVDADGDCYGVDVDCDDNDASINPGATEVCDGVDNDCDNLTDEELILPDCNPNGVCAGLKKTCGGSQGWLECTPEQYAMWDARYEAEETTCDGVDNDCDGVIDEGFDLNTDENNCGYCGNACVSGTTPACCSGVCTDTDADDDNCGYCGTACESGYACVNNACVEQCTPTAELCDNLDNDCNPATADGHDEAWLGDPCDGADSDLCQEGNSICSNGAQSCNDNTGSTIDICNGVNDDCDATSADGSEDPLLGTSCDGTDSDLCNEGTYSCSAGSLLCSDSTSNNLDLCNGINDDCDPASADGSEDPLTGTMCDGPDSDLCQEGTYSCISGNQICNDNTGSTTDVCDGLDNDCDPASADGLEDPQAGTACDTGQPGVCAAGTRYCQLGALECVQDVFSSPEVCDNLDNDCDGSVDEGNPGGGGGCNTGLQGVCAAGIEYCQGGSIQCVQNQAPYPEVCDNVDNDCDGVADDGSAAILCPPGSNVLTTTCTAGVCTVTSCGTGYGDLDGVFANGCECAPDGYEPHETCATALNLGDEHENNAADDKAVTGRISTLADVDFYTFRAIDDNWYDESTDNFHVSIMFSSNPGGEFRYTIWESPIGSCTTLTQRYDGTGTYDDYGTTGVNDTSYYIVKVYRKSGVPNPSCNTYLVTMKNE